MTASASTRIECLSLIRYWEATLQRTLRHRHVCRPGSAEAAYTRRHVRHVVNQIRTYRSLLLDF